MGRCQPTFPQSSVLRMPVIPAISHGRIFGQHGHAVVTQVVPFPEDTSIPLVARYQKALKAFKANSESGFVSLEGYTVGRLVVRVLEEVGKDVTRERFLAKITEVGTFDLDGVTLSYGPEDNQGMDQVFLTVIQAGGKFKAVDRLSK